MIKRLLAYFKNYRVAAIMSPVLMFFEVLGDVAMPVLMAKIINRISVVKEFTNTDIYYILKAV